MGKKEIILLKKIYTFQKYVFQYNEACIKYAIH